MQKGLCPLEDKKTSLIYRIIRWLVWLFYPKTRIVGEEHIPAEASVIVGNHTQMNGPIVGELYFPGKKYIWCAGEMLEWKDVHEYAFRDFWSQKPKWTHWFYKLLSYLITPLAVCIFNNAHTIPVWHDTRLVSTFRTSMQRLQEGNHLIIFPEKDERYNHIVYEFQDRFIDLARMYYRRTGTALKFVPMYIAPALKTAYLGKPIAFDPAAKIDISESRSPSTPRRRSTTSASASRRISRKRSRALQNRFPSTRSCRTATSPNANGRKIRTERRPRTCSKNRRWWTTASFGSRS